MKRTRPKCEHLLINKCVFSLAIAVGFVGTSFGAQFDAPYYETRRTMSWRKNTLPDGLKKTRSSTRN